MSGELDAAYWRAAYAAAWTAGDVESMSACEALGMKPSGAPPSWWLLPPEDGGGIAYQRTIVAELNKLRPGQLRLSPDRLVKVRQAAKMMADAREGAATPAAATGASASGGA